MISRKNEIKQFSSVLYFTHACLSPRFICQRCTNLPRIIVVTFTVNIPLEPCTHLKILIDVGTLNIVTNAADTIIWRISFVDFILNNHDSVNYYTCILCCSMPQNVSRQPSLETRPWNVILNFPEHTQFKLYPNSNFLKEAIVEIVPHFSLQRNAVKQMVSRFRHNLWLTITHMNSDVNQTFLGKLLKIKMHLMP